MSDNWHERLRNGEGKDLLTKQWLDEQPIRLAWETLVGDKRVYCHECDWPDAQLWRSDAVQHPCKHPERGAYLWHCKRHAEEHGYANF